MSQKLPVVIAGAGPTGLMCALALAREGVKVVVCEAEPTLTHDLRAGSFHPPTQEMMAPCPTLSTDSVRLERMAACS